MKSKSKVVVIGGGAVGVSTLYHLAKKGWSDVVLVERKELTSGSTWHAAGLLPLFNMSYSVGQLHKYAVDLYKKLEEETGKNVGFSVVSNIRLASNKDRMDEYHQYAGVAKTIGVDVKFLTPDQVKEIWPLCHTDDLVGAIQHPEDGYIQPADLTQALATGARNKGAEIYRNTTVLAMRQTKDGWIVETDKGSIECEHVISCSGNFARQTGEMVGLDIPVIPVEHQYIVTEPHPEIQKRKKEGLPEGPLFFFFEFLDEVQLQYIDVQLVSLVYPILPFLQFVLRNFPNKKLHVHIQLNLYLFQLSNHLWFVSLLRQLCFYKFLLPCF